MGADGFNVRRIAMMGWDPKKYLEMQRRNPVLKKDEYEFLKSRATLVREIGIETSQQVRVHVGKETVENVQLQGVTPNLGIIANTPPAQGRFIGETENQRRLPVAFIGNDLNERFFAGTNPLGKTIIVEGRPFEVVGVAKTKGSVFGQSAGQFRDDPGRDVLQNLGFAQRHGL